MVFVAVGSIVADYITGGASGLFGVALASGLVIAVMVAATGNISGAHINPAVTIGMLSVGKIDIKNAVAYIISQCLGAIVAMVIIKLCVPYSILWDIDFGAPGVTDAPEFTTTMSLVTEIVLTFMLMFVICGVALKRRPGLREGIIIGFAVTMGILVGGPISGAAMNPARHLGPALYGGGTSEIWLYWLGPVLGGLLAAQLYSRVFVKNGQEA